MQLLGHALKHWSMLSCVPFHLTGWRVDVRAGSGDTILGHQGRSFQLRQREEIDP